MSEVFETAIIEKRNVLNELRANNLSLQELRFFSIYLSRINPRDESTRIVKFPLADFQKIMGLGRMNISHFKASVDSLLTKIVHVPNENGGFEAFQLFKKCKVDKDELGEWSVEINAHDDALPLLFDFKDRYFKYELWNALRLKSPNQIRMYEILKQYENLGKREISVKDLRELLGIAENEYPRWNNFKMKVLDSCQQALKETTDICFTYERGKTGASGKWLTIIFNISSNTPTNTQMSLFEAELAEYIDLKQLTAAAAEHVPEQNDDTDLGSDYAFYMGACNNEFTEKETESLLAIVSSMELPEHELGVDFARYHYLQEQYTHFNAISEQQHIANRYSYFRAMLKADRDKQRGE